MDVRALFRVLRDVAGRELRDFRDEPHDVQRELVRARVHLLHRGDQRLGVEQAGKPHRLGVFDIARRPLVQLRVPLLHVAVPPRE